MAVINTNIMALIGQQNLSKSQSDLQTSMERLSSGLRINSAKDDAAGQGARRWPRAWSASPSCQASRSRHCRSRG